MRARFWGLIITQHRREFYTMYNIERVSALYGGAKVYLPLLEDGKRITPLFSNYLFVQFRRSHGWKWASSILGVKSVMLSGGENLAVVPDKIIAELKAREVDGAVQLDKLSPKLVDGEAVEVLHGPFIGNHAIYEGMSGADRAMVLMTIMGQEVRTMVKIGALGPSPASTKIVENFSDKPSSKRRQEALSERAN